MQILIVDDQPEVVKNIRYSLCWDKLGIDIVYSAFSAQEARQCVMAHPIDIALMDIEMPEENGLSLLQWIRDEHYDMECIFLTCHAEFQYAQRALSLGGSDYVLQPARPSEIEAAIKKAADQVRAKRKTSGLLKALEAEDTGRKQELQNEIAAIFEGTGCDDGSIYPRLREFFGSMVTPLYCPVALEVTEVPPDKREMAASVLMASLKDMEQPFLQSPVTGGWLIVLASQKGSAEAEQTKKRLTNLRKGLMSALSAEVGLYLGYDTAAGIYEPIHLLALALQAGLARRQADGIFRLPLPQLQPREEMISSLETASWTQWLGSGDGQLVLDAIDRYVELERRSYQLSALKLKQIHYLFSQAFFAVIDQNGLDTNGLFDAGYSYEEFTKSYDCYKRMRDILQHCVMRFNELRCMSTESRLASACQYIRDNISKEISRADVAGFVFLNEEYFSRLFKKETGLGFKDYVLREKMRYAKRLLASTDFSVGIIGSKVGYANFSYFSKVFGKTVGMSPLDYRKAHHPEYADRVSP